ncbi:hypothetical protein AVEN_74397-1 [Araneus ventricosus]|uniref:Uncharacterized protein n=1 Tax=Araneus ventricosus TaxID=182803 RepID=A0A4Y2HFL4_ARAVE|nr:hypothetical protein AVEN_74397-1 [Araneus ventricosus]
MEPHVGGREHRINIAEGKDSHLGFSGAGQCSLSRFLLKGWASLWFRQFFCSDISAKWQTTIGNIVKRRKKRKVLE